MDIQIQTNTSIPIKQEPSQGKPYAPSFIDRFMDFVERLPIPYGLTYLLFFILQSFIFQIIGWMTGWLPVYTFSPLVLLFPLWLWGPLAIMTYLDSVSLKALAGFSPLLDIQPESMRRLKYEFTTMPARSVIISSVIWGCIYFIFTYVTFDTVYPAYGFGTLITAIVIIEGLISFLAGSAIYYHSIRQLRLVNRTVKMVKQLDLFRLDPVYAFSVVTSRTGLAYLILLSLTLLMIPIQMAFLPTLIMLILQVLLAAAAFTLPLGIVNHRLVTEKRRLLAELNQRLESTLERLHRCLDENKLGEVDQLNSAMTALNAEREVLTRIPTWPWRAGTITGFLSAIVLPIILFLMQLVIGKWFGG
jgi:tetrahydromethanopterin S-methyltransferase subunit F